MTRVAARAAFVVGLALFAIDVARLEMTGVAVLGATLMAAAGLAAGALSPGFWITEAADQNHPRHKKGPGGEPGPATEAPSERERS